MHLQTAESNGPSGPEPIREGPKKPLKEFKQHSTSLPFGQHTSLASIGGPTYVTAQELIQQVAYTLSDRLWTYSPETFDLDLAVKEWCKDGAKNAYGQTTMVESMQIRQGAASIALGYVFSKDFDMKKRHVPQSIVASSSALQYLRAALDQLSLLYSISSPFVAHVAALDFAGASSRLVADYVTALSLAEEMGFGLLSSFSAYEAQHMALFATLLAQIVPTIHIFDGVSVARETTRVIDVLDQAGLYNTYKAVQYDITKTEKKSAHLDTKIATLLKAFNDELGTQYGLFEYLGHASPESILVVFGTIESSMASQVATSLENDGARVGVLNVRVYKPFVEEAFLASLPGSVKKIGVLGQVVDQDAVSDVAVRSNLYNDVVAAISFSDKWVTAPAVIDIKYPRETVWTPVSIAALFQLLVKKPLLQQDVSVEAPPIEALQLLDSAAVQQYTFWNIDTSDSVNAPAILGQALAIDSANNVTANATYDNLLQGGVVRSDIRKSKKTIEASYAVDTADVAYVGDQSLLKIFDVARSIRPGGKLIINLSAVKDDDVENRLPMGLRRALSTKNIKLFILDPSAIESVAEDPASETYLVQSAFLRVALPTLEKTGLQKLSMVNGSIEILEHMAQDLDKALRIIEVPESWSGLEIDEGIPSLPANLRPSSFSPFDKIEIEPPSYLKDWKSAATGLAFKEAFKTSASLRPDLTNKTYTVHVSENRRLTPPSYDRNIFHIEFNLGNSGLTYDIGEALGIHAENDPDEVNSFIDFYKLNPSEIVEVPSRENANVLENRTVYQSLVQNIDIFGRPPKRFYEALSEFADDPKEANELRTLGSPEGANEFKRRAEVDTLTYADILLEFPSAHPAFHDIVRIVNPMKRREYSIASCQKVTPTSVALMIVVVGWVDPQGRDRFGQATRYLHKLQPGFPVTVSVKPSVMKLPPKSTQPLIMAGLGTGLAPFRAFVQHRAWEKAQGKEIGDVLLYMGSRHKREEYCYGEEWEAYQDAGVITLLGCAFSRDQPQKIYIQDRMRQTMGEIIKAYLKEDGAFYLCTMILPLSLTTTHLLTPRFEQVVPLGPSQTSQTCSKML